MEPTKEIIDAIRNDDAIALKRIIKRLKDSGDIECVDHIWSKKTRCNLLHFAARYNAVKAADVLFVNEIWLNWADREGVTPLQYAAAAGAIKFMAWYIISKGISCDEKNLEKERTPLHIAAINNRTDSAAFLVGCGADVEAKDVLGMTPLLYSFKYSSTRDLPCFLINKAKANVNVCDNKGWTPAHYAAARNNVKLIRELFFAHADFSAKDKDGLTPFDLASTKKAKEAIKRFERIRQS